MKTITSRENNTLEDRIILHQSESMPENSTVHSINLIVVLGKIALNLNKMGIKIYPTGSIINIPAKTRMSISNQLQEETEIHFVKV